MATDLDATALASGGNGAHGAGGVEQRGFGDVVGVGEGGFLAGDGAHAHALVDAEAAGLDDALFEAPAFAARVLEVQVGVVDAVLRDDAQGVQQGRFVQTIRREQQVTGGLQAGKGGFDGDHGRILARQWAHRLSRALTRRCSSGLKLALT